MGEKERRITVPDSTQFVFVALKAGKATFSA